MCGLSWSIPNRCEHLPPPLYHPAPSSPPRYFSLTSAGASTIIPNSYNVLAKVYNTSNCISNNNATDNFTVVSGTEFFTDDERSKGGCYQLEEGGRYMHSRCRTDGSVVTLEYASNDTTCSGEVFVQVTSAQTSMSCDTLEIDGFYYRYTWPWQQYSLTRFHGDDRSIDRSIDR